MSQKKGKLSSLKSIEKECSTIAFDSDNTGLLITSSRPESTLASAILSRGFIRTNRKFHISFVQPVLMAGSVDEMRMRYGSYDVLFIGVNIQGSKSIKKGKNSPLFIGCRLEPEKVTPPALGTESSVAATAYTLAKSLMKADRYDLQLAAAGAIIQTGTNDSRRGPNKEIIDLAEKEKVIEKRKGFKLFGVGMLPLDEALAYSTHPYLHSISGNPKVCDEILNAAEIPIPKIRSSFSSLSTLEAQSLTSQLISRLDPEVVTRLLGSDYILVRERESSPIRYVSGIEIVANTAWTRNELGMLMSIWLGDRGRSLRVLIDSQMAHHKEVLSVVLKLHTEHQIESTSSATIIRLPGIKPEILSDVGRIVLESNIVDPTHLAVFDNNESFIITWPSSKLNLNTVLTSLLQKAITPASTSPQSVTIAGSSQTKELGLQAVMTLYGEDNQT